ncbi:MAG: hypothetical protein J1F38_09020 [Muribaculaceae bacterium]|nr:hypothetical protein [Muribaculaceae bacterium]
MKHFLPSLFFLLILPALLFSCKKESRQIIPYEVDSDEIYKPLKPNEEDNPYPTYGIDNIPGVTFDYEMTTPDNEVYIFFDNLTLLDVNPAITQFLFNFISYHLKEYGFINPSDNSALPGVAELIHQGLAFDKAAASLLETIQKEFEQETDTILSYKTPFNAHFQIYPLFLTSDLVSYRLSAYFFTGGAHGMSVSNIFSFNLRDGHMYSFDEIIRPEDRKFVRQEIAARMAYAYPIYENINTVDQYIDSLNVWLDHFDPDERQVKITEDNFPVSDVALLKTGIVSIYQMYELTPGSDGCPLIFIPYDDIKGCLSLEISE